MYLLVFITLVISLIGLYTQTFALQTARMMSHQTGFANAMLAWQAAAVSMGASIAKTQPLYTSACSLTYLTLPKPNPFYPDGCPTPINLTTGFEVNTVPSTATAGTINNPTTLTTGSLNSIYNTKTDKNEQVHLPKDYDPKTYQFYSILYQVPPNQNYVVTFATQPTAGPSSGFITLPSGFQLGISLSDLYQQMQNTGAPNFTYGVIKGDKLTATQTFVYPLPAGAVPDNAVGFVASPDGF
jgi:hypothetical protein